VFNVGRVAPYLVEAKEWDRTSQEKSKSSESVPKIIVEKGLATLVATIAINTNTVIFAAVLPELWHNYALPPEHAQLYGGGVDYYLYRDIWGALTTSSRPILEVKPDPVPVYRLCRAEAPANVIGTPTMEEVAKKQIGPFLREVYNLCQRNDLDGAGDRVFDFVDRLLCNGLFAACDQMLMMAKCS
jgi:hypothetical protein